jgi:polyisoprenoid-binding protein YceI
MAGSAASTPESAPADATSAASGDTPAPAAQDVALTPGNAKIQFVGTHVGDDPKPRTGTFAKFVGSAALEGEGLKSVQVDIETASLTTDIEKLTNHLKSPDFFDVNQFPQAKFVSTAIEPAGDGMVTITGDLTVLETTKSISFPATISTADGLKLNAEFVIDRTQFGMTYGDGQVVNDVTLTVTVGP